MQERARASPSTSRLKGFSYYEERKREGSEPARQVEQGIATYLDSGRFQVAYPDAYARWREAADLLWGADSERELSTIGHKCREAIQEFVTALVGRAPGRLGALTGCGAHCLHAWDIGTASAIKGAGGC